MYINTQTLMQLSESEIRALNPNTSYPVPFPVPEGYAYVFPTAQPVHNPVTQFVQQATPELTVLGHWEQRWTVVELYATQEDKDAAIAADTEAKRVAAVPAEITMRQARLALLGAGKLAAVDTAIDAMVEPAKSAAKIEWEYSNTVQRHNGFVAALGPALGLTDAQIDALFLAAQAL